MEPKATIQIVDSKQPVKAAEKLLDRYVRPQPSRQCRERTESARLYDIACNITNQERREDTGLEGDPQTVKGTIHFR
jgi:hypothetical protein